MLVRKTKARNGKRFGEFIVSSMEEILIKRNSRKTNPYKKRLISPEENLISLTRFIMSIIPEKDSIEIIE